MLEKAEVYRMFKLINDDFNQHGIQMRIGQSVMNNLRTLDYSLYLKLTGSEIDPFYMEDKVMSALISISNPNIIRDTISKYYKDNKTNYKFKLKLEKLL
jgi:hypothetical protein